MQLLITVSLLSFLLFIFFYLLFLSEDTVNGRPFLQRGVKGAREYRGDLTGLINDKIEGRMAGRR